LQKEGVWSIWTKLHLGPLFITELNCLPRARAMSTQTEEVFDRVRSQHREIVKKLIERVPSAAESGSDRHWTDAVMRILHDLCIEHLGPCQAHFHGRHSCGDGPTHAEWLLDALWWYQTNDSQSVLLGVESEWSDSTFEVCSDYSKLLAVKVPIKIGLYWDGAKRRKKSTVSRMEGLNKLCREWTQHLRGEFLYAINFHDGRHDTYFYEVTRDGVIPDFRFESLPELSGADHLVSS
jgi:hypothetical protein